ncbi:hypothetical protein [Brevibacterium renqingii]|uniref:hypothetical protein n=1 Tax=Brevibacterium renqingii TaxID=2776916 RepID=UPI001ADF49E8|nr:hypothetical protein [Brevibacterium renqingii]
MSNGNDHPHFPPPPSEPPETGGSKPHSEHPTDEGRERPTPAEETNSSTAPQAESREDSSDAPEIPGSASSSDAEATQALPAPDFDDPSAQPQTSESSSVPDDEAPPLGTSADQPSAGEGQTPPPAPQFGGSSESAPPRPTVAPAPSSHSQNDQHQGGQYQNGPYPGGPAYAGAQNQAGQFQTGSGPNHNRTGSGPGQSQAIPQPAPAPGFAGSQAAASRADSRPQKKSRLPLFITLGAVGLVIVLVLVGFLVIGSVNKNNYGPDKVAEDYVAALNKGDFAAAEKIAPSPRPEGTNVDLLSKEFTEPSSAKIERAKVESSKVDGDKGTVVVSYELDGSPYNVELSAKKDGKQDLFFDKWTLTGPELNVVSLDIPAADGLTVNGEDYKAKSGTTSFAVYPGNYEFKIPSSKWVSEASDTAGVNFPKAFAPGGKPNEGQVAPTTLNLDLAPTKAFEKEVQKQVEAELEKCFDNKSIEPKCKFIKFDPTEIPVGGSDKKLDDLAKKNTAKWDMKEMPKVKASFGAGDTNTGSFFTEKPGKFNFTVDGKKAGSSYFSNGNSLSVSGSVKIDGDKLSVEFFDF